MTYSEDLRENVLTYGQAKRVIESHGLDFTEYMQEVVQTPFDGDTIADWLGY